MIGPRFAAALGLVLAALTPPRRTSTGTLRGFPHPPAKDGSGRSPAPSTRRAPRRCRRSHVPPAPAPPAERERGVALGLFAEDVSFSYAPLLAEIVALGATHVALVVPLYQTDGASDDLGLDTRFSPTLDTVAETVRAARRDGLEVTIFPIVRLSAPRAGRVARHAGAARSRRLVPSYGDMLGDLAGVAATTGAKRLVVGSELSTLDGDLERWRPLVEKVRGGLRRQAGLLGQLGPLPRTRALFDLVDEEGISGYFNLRDAKAPDDDATREAGWRRVRRELEAWRAGARAALRLHGARLPLARRRDRRALGRGPRRHARSGRAAPRLRRLPPRLGRLADRSTASTSGTGTATAAPPPPATRPAASPPRPRCGRSWKVFGTH